MPTRRRTRKKPKKTIRAHLARWGLISVLLLCALTTAYAFFLNEIIKNRFEGRRWAIPARVYARPLELYPGKKLQPRLLEMELQLAGYRQTATPSSPGSYFRSGDTFLITTREFDFGEGEKEPSVKLAVECVGDTVVTIKENNSRKQLQLVRVDPPLIGSFLPRESEDRVLLKREELPETFIKSLMAVEDRNFYDHHGVDPRGILRAAWVNIRSGSTVQGGSTLTQQLVKNFFLTNKRSFWRKFNEAIMALLLDWHYDKDEILTAYANEIFLGQDGERAIHGFGLASQFYFQRSIEHLDFSQTALLVGMVKGPSYYDPRRHPERCLKRRQMVLQVMRDTGIITDNEFRTAASAPLMDTRKNLSGFNRFPGFLDLVRRQMRRDYREEDLTSEGLKIFTTLDPEVQWIAEDSLSSSITDLENRKNILGLEGAVVVTNSNNGEIEAIVGSRAPKSSGFNRALDAYRPVGSLIKPAVYLAAIENGYTLGDKLDDTAVALKNHDGSQWTPRNFDRQEHGRVTLYEALIHSYNLATVKVGLAIGVDKVVSILERLGYEKNAPSYPSLFLGAVSMSPLEVSQMYQTLAGEGFHIPLRAIRTVLDIDNRPLQRFPLKIEQRIAPEPVFILNTALQGVVHTGTASSLSAHIPASHELAGKTGTSDDARDSWYAGFSGDNLTVVWLGNDDNRAIHLTGSSGALVVWGKMFQNMQTQPLRLTEPPGIQWRKIEVASNQNGRLKHSSVSLPFIRGTYQDMPEPASALQTGDRLEKKKNPVTRLLDWLF